MKYKHLATVAAITALAACDSNEWTGVTSPATDAVQGNEAPILFQSGSSAQTRANGTIITGSEAAERLGGQFRVYGAKTDANDVSTVPFNNYVVMYEPNGKTDDPEASNQWGWEYMGKTSLGTTPIQQGVVYWDLSAKQYDFVAFSGLPDNLKINGFGGINVDIDTHNKQLVYASDKVTATKDGGMTGTTQNAKFREAIVLNFSCLTSRARMAIYETVPGYAIKDVRFYYGDNAGANLGTSTKTKAGLQGKFFTKATYTVTYDANNKMQSAMTTPDTDEDNFIFGELDYTTAKSSATNAESYLKGNGAIVTEAEADKVFLGTTATTATFAKVNGMDWQPILPYETNETKMKLFIDFTLVPLDGSMSTIAVHGAHVTIPIQYCQWKPNYAYTYLFRITDKTNGTTDPDPDPEDPDNPGLYAITFDAVVDETEDTLEDIFSNVEGKEDGSNTEHDTPAEP